MQNPDEPNKIPPGYEDQDKGEPGMFGDLILWKQIIAKSKETQKDIIFVSDDLKNDWLLIVKGKRIGLRPELRKEFTENTNHSVLYYDSPNFFKYVTSYLNPGNTITSDTMQTITSVSNSISWYRPQTAHKLATSKTSSWFAQQPIFQSNSNISAEDMLEWWYSIYEDPANSVPYDTKEGGYQYFSGGPYDPKEELLSHFTNDSIIEINKAVQRITNDGVEWVKKGEY